MPKSNLGSKPWFAFASLLATDIYDQVVNIGGGSAQPNISSGQIENCSLVLPSFDLIDLLLREWVILT